MTRKLLVILPYCSSDISLAIRLLGWIKELGECKENDVLLVAATQVEKEAREQVAKAASTVFASVETISPPFALKDEKWPRGANLMFETAVMHLLRSGNGMPFLWLEPDCVPMRENWLRDIERAYFRCGRPFFGHVVTSDKPGLPLRMLSGVAVYAGYPEMLKLLLKQTAGSKQQAWDVKGAGELVPRTAATSLIWNLWGLRHELAPTFVKQTGLGSPVNATNLDVIPRSCALYHRCKDGSLIRLLKEKRSGDSTAISGAVKTQPKRWCGVVHCVEKHFLRRKEDGPRVERAFLSWEKLYADEKMKPAHLWEHEYPRTSLDIGDDRKLPYLKDVLAFGMKRAKGADEIVLLTNDDTYLMPGAVDEVSKMLTGEVRACCSWRVTVDSVDGELIVPSEMTPDFGRDLFAFRKSWLDENWSRIPDMLLGELEWDLVLMTMIRQSAGLKVTLGNRKKRAEKCELPIGLVLHERHSPVWMDEKEKSSPAKVHNAKLAKKFYRANGLPTLANFKV